ncbi:hypothetical protein N7536_011027 [Penicillium majusculum]|nr:hypothetical protein N7536_011027 [Penicillium majusculum]
MEPRGPESARESKSPVDRSAGASKYAYIATVVLFEADSALCGDAPNMNAVGRVITVAVNLVSGHLGLS